MTADIMEICSRWATGSSFYIMKTPSTTAAISGNVGLSVLCVALFSEPNNRVCKTQITKMDFAV